MSAGCTEQKKYSDHMCAAESVVKTEPRVQREDRATMQWDSHFGLPSFVGSARWSESEILPLKRESRILGQWSNSLSGSRKSQTKFSMS